MLLTGIAWLKPSIREHSHLTLVELFGSLLDWPERHLLLLLLQILSPTQPVGLEQPAGRRTHVGAKLSPTEFQSLTNPPFQVRRLFAEEISASMAG